MGALSNEKRVEPQEGKEKELAKREGKTKLSFYAKESEVRRVSWQISHDFISI